MPADDIIIHSEKMPDGVTVVYINGNIICNLSGTGLRVEVERLLKNDRPRIVLNIKDVRYLDSYSFGWLAKIYKLAKEKGGSFVISDANNQIFSLMQMLQFDRTVPIYDTENTALEELRKL